MPETTTAACPECRNGRVLVDEMASQGCEVHVQPYRIGMRLEGYEDCIMRCPKCHVAWWVEPTTEQKLSWAQDGAE